MSHLIKNDLVQQYADNLKALLTEANRIKQCDGFKELSPAIQMTIGMAPVFNEMAYNTFVSLAKDSGYEVTP